MTGAGQFRVLCVCVGNACRSVLAEHLVRHAVATRLAGGSDWFAVASAGTHARPGQGMHPLVREILRVRGAPVDRFASRRLDPAWLAEADLVLTATTVERDRAISLLPAALRRTFTVLEFAKLAEAAAAARTGAPRPPGPDPVARARAGVGAAQAMRGRLPYVEPSGWDLPDPSRTRAGLQDCADRIESALRLPMELLFPLPATAVPLRP